MQADTVEGFQISKPGQLVKVPVEDLGGDAEEVFECVQGVVHVGCVEGQGRDQFAKLFEALGVKEVRLNTAFKPVLVDEVELLGAALAGGLALRPGSEFEVGDGILVRVQHTIDGVASLVAKVVRHLPVCFY